MKKFLTIAMSLILTLSLAACGSQGSSNSGSVDTTSSASQHNR